VRASCWTRKATLLKVIGSKVVNYVTLQTALCQVEEVVNSRPLTYVTSNEIVEIITPNSFLRPAHIRQESGEMPDDIISTTSTLIQGYKTVQSIVDHYRSAFYGRYLQLLRERHVRLHPAPKGAVSFTPKIGHVVLIKLPQVSRAKWPLGVVEGLDGRKARASVRIIDWTKTNKLKIALKSKKSYPNKVVQKPISQLYLVELAPEEIHDPEAPAAKRVADTVTEVS